MAKRYPNNGPTFTKGKKRRPTTQALAPDPQRRKTELEETKRTAAKTREFHQHGIIQARSKSTEEQPKPPPKEQQLPTPLSKAEYRVPLNTLHKPDPFGPRQQSQMWEILRKIGFYIPGRKLPLK
jgi:hypothetical protein